MNDKQENKEKRPVQLQEKHKKWMVFTALFLLFVGVMYVIFAPNSDDKTAVKGSQGMNVSIPEATNVGLLDDKQSAYEQQQLAEAKKRKQQAIANLSDLFQNDSATKPMPQRNRYASSNNPIKSSVSAYRNIHQTLDNFYTEDNSEAKALQEEVENLKKQLASKNDVFTEEERQLALLEKSYQMASKYLPSTRQGTMPSQGNAVQVTPMQNGKNKKILVKSVQQYRETVVSSLQESDWSNEQLFTTAVGTTQKMQRNTIKACVHQTMEIIEGESVAIRLLESIQVATMVVPVQTVLMAIPKLEGNRLLLTIASIQYQGVLVPVELSAYDLDGQKGLFVPGTLEQNAVKEILASLGSASGNAFSLNNSASEQLVTDIGRGALKGTSNYLKKKIGRTKIKVKAGHSVLLLSEIQ